MMKRPRALTRGPIRNMWQAKIARVPFFPPSFSAPDVCCGLDSLLRRLLPTHDTRARVCTGTKPAETATNGCVPVKNCPRVYGCSERPEGSASLSA